jgi:general secretion pathway protein H
MNRPIRSKSAGFTLVELLVVVGLLGLTLAIVAAGRPRSSALRLQTEAQTLVRELSRARRVAIVTNSEAVVLIDPTRHRVSTGRSSRQIAVDMGVTVTIADTERSTQGGGFRFYPDGQSSGGDILLAMHGREARISVNWLTGQPRLVQ